MTKNYSSIAVLGLGIIGGSILKRLAKQRSQENSFELFAWNHNSRMQKEVEKMNVVFCKSVEEVILKKPEVIFICLPIQNLESIFEELSKFKNDGKLSNKTTIVDIASVKEFPRSLSEKYSLSDQYVGSHPMFGNEKTGFENSTAELPDRATWAVCPAMNDSSRSKASVLSHFLRDNLYALNVVYCDAKEHDTAVALSSHVPHVLAYELAAQICEGTKESDLAKKLQASSFHGATRVATGNEKMFEGMLFENKTAISPLLRKVASDLNLLADSMDAKVSANNRLKKDVHHFIERSSDFRSSNSDMLNSKEELKKTHRHDADGWVDCRCGKEHWGLNGAAGVFLVRFNLAGKVESVLLQKRALWSAEGGTWGTPGGAISFSETPVTGALREAEEEANVKESKVEVIDEIVRDHGDWKYTTVIAKEKQGEKITPKIMDKESLAVEFKTIDEIKKLPLLSAFSREFDELIKRAEKANAK